MAMGWGGVGWLGDLRGGTNVFGPIKLMRGWRMGMGMGMGGGLVRAYARRGLDLFVG
jgi:hypothetical protein